MQLMKLDISKVLNDEAEGFIRHISISKKREDQLKEVREVVRMSIRAAFEALPEAFQIDSTGRAIYQYPSALSHVEERLLALNTEQKKALTGLSPRFYSQGSFVYGTLNSPCHKGQQIDIDDGVYLPLEDLKGTPQISNKLFFEIIDNTLQGLAKEMDNWIFFEKNTCSRIQISDDAHVDVPLYAIPRREFELIVESMSINSQKSEKGIAMDSRKMLDKDEIHLAIREPCTWQQSDPMAIKAWFQSHIEYHGEILRRVCRYMKAWRDYSWSDGGGPSSIALMACVCDSFNQLVTQRKSKFNDNDDGLALLHCSRILSEQLNGVIDNPIDPENAEKLHPRSNMSTQDRSEVVEFAHKLYEALDLSVNSTTPAAAIDSLRNIFGERVPNKEHLITYFNAAAIVASTPAVTQAAPEQVNSEAG